MRRLLGSIATMVMVTSLLHAQAPPQARIKLGDELTVFVYGAPDMSGPFTVQSDGAIYVPRAGRIVVDGLTTEMAQSRLLARLKTIFNEPSATISIRTQRQSSVYVVGGKEGVLPLYAETDLRQVFAAAKPEGDPDLLQVSVYRNGVKVATMAATDITSGRSNVLSGPLRPNDLVVFEPKPFIRVWVLGTVLKPGRVRIDAGDDVYKAIAEAGDLAVEPTAGPARLRSDYTVTIRRGPQLIQVPLVDQPNRKPTVLEDGDTVSVQPPVQIRVTFTGYSRNPGERFFKSGTSLATAVGAEGGAAPGTPPTANSPSEPEGSLRNVILFHNGIASFHDLSSLTSGPIVEQGPVLGDGDVVFVPRNERKIYVFGAVNRVGRVQLADNRVYRLADAVAEAGGLTVGNGTSNGGTLTRVSVGRPGTDGKLEVKTYRLDKFIKAGDATQNPVLRPDDVVYVDTSRGLTFQSAISAISAALLIDSLTRR